MYAGSKFWSSKVCEEGESRGAYACRLTFDPTQFFSEINDHVTQTHFWSVFKLIENSILIQFELMKVGRGSDGDISERSIWDHQVPLYHESGSKLSFRTIYCHVIDESFENGSKVGLSYVIINFGPKVSNWTVRKCQTERSKSVKLGVPKALKWTVQNYYNWWFKKIEP